MSLDWNWSERRRAENYQARKGQRQFGLSISRRRRRCLSRRVPRAPDIRRFPRCSPRPRADPNRARSLFLSLLWGPLVCACPDAPSLSQTIRPLARRSRFRRECPAATRHFLAGFFGRMRAAHLFPPKCGILSADRDDSVKFVRRLFLSAFLSVQVIFCDTEWWDILVSESDEKCRWKIFTLFFLFSENVKFEYIKNKCELKVFCKL